MVRSRQKLGKYRIESRLAEGSFADVFRAMDTIEGIRVALKIPHEHFMNREFMEDFRTEVRLTAKLDHPNILSVKDASIIDARFVIAFPLGEKTLHDRLQSRMSLRTTLDYAEQLLEAVAYAHSNRVIHCDIKPENLILFPGNRLRLTDFGIAKVAHRTLQASGSGTVGYVAPEQAMGKPSFRSDVFSIGLIMYRMLSGTLPEWPYKWPLPGSDKLKKRIHPDLIGLVRKAMDINPRRRFRDGVQMLAALRKIKPRTLSHYTKRSKTPRAKTGTQDWRTVRIRQFQKQFGKNLETRFTCSRCNGPVSELMHACPWCGQSRKIHRDETRFPAHCPRCNRGVKLDWAFCPWCFGPGFEPSERQYTDKRYEGRCSNPGCSRKSLMPYMRYCPWCRRKVQKKWKVSHSGEKCPSCNWGVYRSFWDFCPWCGKALRGR